MSESVCGRSSVYPFNVTARHLLVSDAGLFRITPTGHAGLRRTPATGVVASAPSAPPWACSLSVGRGTVARQQGRVSSPRLSGAPLVPCVQDAGSFIPPPEGAPSLALGRGSAGAAGQPGTVALNCVPPCGCLCRRRAQHSLPRKDALGCVDSSTGHSSHPFSERFLAAGLSGHGESAWTGDWEQSG